MIHLADDLRSHISRSATRILSVIGNYLSRNPQVCDADVALVVEHKILRLQISMDNLLSVHILETEYDAGQEELGLFLGEISSVAQMVSEIPTIAVLHNEV